MYDRNKRRLDLTNPRDQKIALMIASIFIPLTGVASYFMLVRPISKARQAKNWIETECVIESEELKTSTRHVQGRPRRVSRLVVRYSYEYEGKKYESDKYGFTGTTGTSGSGITVAKTRPPGTKTICYVNPDNPVEAVLSGEVSLKGILWGLLPAGMFIIGIIGLLKVLRHMLA